MSIAMILPDPRARCYRCERPIFENDPRQIMDGFAIESDGRIFCSGGCEAEHRQDSILSNLRKQQHPMAAHPRWGR